VGPQAVNVSLSVENGDRDLWTTSLLLEVLSLQLFRIPSLCIFDSLGISCSESSSFLIRSLSACFPSESILLSIEPALCVETCSGELEYWKESVVAAAKNQVDFDASLLRLVSARTDYTKCSHEPNDSPNHRSQIDLEA
jgi:hypothetical protein